MEMTYYSYFFAKNVHVSKVENAKVSRFKLKFYLYLLSLGNNLRYIKL